MTSRGPKPIPNEIKQKTGTYRADRHGTAGLTVLPQAEGIPTPPDTLGQLGLNTWQRLFTEATWLHHTADYEIVRILCENLDEREQLKDTLAEDKDNWRLRGGIRELEKQIVSTLGSLGLNPTDRARYGFAIVKTESKLQEFLREADEEKARRARGDFSGSDYFRSVRDY